jgi:uncharacterized tellurite resistance protein B-like protein
MLSRLLERLRGDPVIHDAEIKMFPRHQIAVVVLLVEASQIDRVVTDSERAAIVRIVSERFGLQGDAALHLIELAEGCCTDTLEDWAYTSAIRDGFSIEERGEVLEMLWEVVYADGRLVQLEETLMGRLASQLGIDEQALEAEREYAFARIGLSQLCNEKSPLG